MKFNREQITKAAEILEGAKVMVLNRDFDDFQNAIITALNTFALVKELTEENEFHRTTISENAQTALEVTLDEIEKAKYETVLRMQQILTSDEFYIVADDHDGMQYVDFCAWVEEVAKEMLED